MSWFGETFGDSLNSLKGQITKITKEVLAEDDNENEELSESVKLKLKELDALCSSKDLEIHSLREENQKISHQFQEELKLLRNENKKLRSDSKKNGNETLLLTDHQIQQVCELENQLKQVQIERDHLEELQKDHQKNICLVMQQRDNSKQELEKLKADYSDLQVKYNELLSNRECTTVTNDLLDVNIVECKDDEVVNLRNIVEKLQTQIETYQNEKEETSKVIERHMVNSEILKEKIEKLMEEIKILNSEKESMELENRRLKDAIDAMKADLNGKLDEFKLEQKRRNELEEDLNNVTQMLERSKAEQINFKSDVETQVKKLLKVFIPNDKCSDESSLSLSIDQIENVWRNNLRERENAELMHSEGLHKLQTEIQRLESDKSNLEIEVKVAIDKRNEVEHYYKEELNSLQNKYLELKSQEQDCIIKSQTDDVKRLEQEVTRLMELVESKNNELKDCYHKIDNVTQELNTTRSLSANIEQDLLKLVGEREQLEKSVSQWRCECEKKEKEAQDILENSSKAQERCQLLESEKAQLQGTVSSLQDQLNEVTKRNKELDDSIQSLKRMTERTAALERELEEAIRSRGELEKVCADMQKMKLSDSNQSEYLKAQLIIKETTAAELNTKNKTLTDEVSSLKEEVARLGDVESELNRWKETMVDLEMQRQELSDQRKSLEKECATLRSQLANDKQSGEEVERLRGENATLVEACNRLQHELQSQLQSEQMRHQGEMNFAHNQAALHSELENLKIVGQQQANMIASLTYENSELKQHLQVANERMAALADENNQLKVVRPQEEARGVANLQSQASREKLSVQQHRRSRSDADFDATAADDADSNSLRLEIERLSEVSRRQQRDYKTLQEQYSSLCEKESHSRRELERLRLHLIEIENDYTETIDEYKTKLNVTEEQLKNSSTFYTSTKVRDNQHLESLQSQIRLMSAQRDDLQAKLSAAEDEVQKHKAALTSFHVVLEQFQQDKEREFESMETKHQNQLMLSKRRFAELEQEINSLNNQLSDAKNGLKAASRLGEQLERKSEQINELEQRLSAMAREMEDLEERAKLANQSNFGKVDKSLVKNLLVGYVSSQKADRKEQVLRILMSVLDFDEEERNKIALDNTHSGWLSNLLHPRGDGTQTSQSLSEAFIRFLENESRPQPQLKLLPERTPQGDKPRPASTTPKPSLLLQELVLPTFNSPQSNESTILKDVLNDS